MIISLSGKKQSGKDTIASLLNSIMVENSPNRIISDYFKVKRFAGTLKKVVSDIISIPLEDLESEAVKNSILGEEWWYYENNNGIYPYLENKHLSEVELKEKFNEYKLVKLTPRIVLQLLGTECGRKIIHPNIWINSTLADYNLNENWIITDTRFPNEVQGIRRKTEKSVLINIIRLKTSEEWFESFKHMMTINKTPNLYTNDSWSTEKISIETFIDRFEKAESYFFGKEYYDFKETLLHESENALNSFEDWDYQIYNDGSLEDLKTKLKDILIKEKII